MVVWWYVIIKEILGQAEGHEGVVLGVDTREEGQVVVSCGIDRTVRVWERLEGEGEVTAKGDEDVEIKDEEGDHGMVNGINECHEGENSVNGVLHI